MAFDDYLESEVGVAVAVTAVVASPAVRRVLRKGAVYGLAGVLMAGDAVTSLARGVKSGMQSAPPTPPGPPEEITREASGASESSASGNAAEGAHPSSARRGGGAGHGGHSGGHRGASAHA